MPSRSSFAYRRSAQLRAAKAVQVETQQVETIYTKAADDFQTFCTLLDKAPATHMLQWYDYLITHESNK